MNSEMEIDEAIKLSDRFVCAFEKIRAFLIGIEFGIIITIIFFNFLKR